MLAPNWEDNSGLLGDDQANRPGSQPTSAPLLVLQGTADAVIPAEATDRFVTAELCAAEHDTVDYMPVAGAGHTGVLVSGAPTLLRWMRQRIAGKAPPSSCGAAAAAQTSRKRRTAKAEPITPTPMPTIATSTQVPATSHPLNDIWAMMLPWFSAVFVVSRPMP